MNPKSAVKVTTIVIVSALLAAIRIAGCIHEAFQAIAHLWVGGLCGAFMLGRYFQPSIRRLCGWLVVILSIIEVACFIAGLRR